LIEHGFTSPPTQYRLYGRRVLCSLRGEATERLLRLWCNNCLFFYVVQISEFETDFLENELVYCQVDNFKNY